MSPCSPPERVDKGKGDIAMHWFQQNIILIEGGIDR